MFIKKTNQRDMVALLLVFSALLGSTATVEGNQSNLRTGNGGGGQETHERQLILGGKEQDRIKSFAFIVTYDPEDEKFKQCGGTLVEENVVLTAAHCVEGEKFPVLVALGATYAKQGFEDDLKAAERKESIPGANDVGKDGWQLGHNAKHISTVTKNKDNWVTHKDYKGENDGFRHDIALIKLDDPAQTTACCFFSPDAKIQDLQNNSDEPKDDDKVYAIGHGNTAKSVPSEVLKVGKMVVDASGEACKDSKEFDNEIMVCAKNEKWKDVEKEVLKRAQNNEKQPNDEEIKEMFDGYGTPCKGDSGGPLYSKSFARDKADTDDQVGITSHGSFSCAGWEVFTRVGYYKDWIVQEAKKLSEK